MKTSSPVPLKGGTVIPGGKLGSLSARLPKLASLLLLLPLLAATGCGTQEVKMKTTTARSLIAEPVFDPRLSREDFGFPSQPPLLSVGRDVFSHNCQTCHAANYFQQPRVQHTLAYTTPIDYYIMLSTGKANQVQLNTPERESFKLVDNNNHDVVHPVFRDTLSRDQRWSVIFYTRFLAGYDDKSLPQAKQTIDNIFGQNCAVCHGKRGFADGPLFTGHPSSHELGAGKVHVGLFQPPPANFHDYRRLYNRTDAQLFKYVSEGIYPSAMPAWLGNVDKDKSFTFDDNMIWKLVRYVRGFSYTYDLPDSEVVPPGPIPARPSDVNPLIPPVNSMALVNRAPAEKTQQEQAAHQENKSQVNPPAGKTSEMPH